MSIGIGLSATVPLTLNDALVAVSLLLVILVIERLDVSIPISSGTLRVSAGAPVALASAMHFGVGIGCLIVLTGHILDSVLARRDPIKSVTNIATFVTATAVGGFVYRELADLSTSPVGSAGNLLAALGSSAAFVAVSTASVAMIVAPIIGMPMQTLWQSTVRLSAIETVTFPAVGGLVALAAAENAFAVVLLAFPLLGPQVAYRTLIRAQRSVRDTLESLADAVEQRDLYTSNHSIRVTETVKRILHEMPDIPYELTETIVQAARVHDIGKVGTRDVTLYKTGPLTTEERVEMQRHAEVGSVIVARTEEYRLTAEIIRHHHEFWNGGGYPDKLSGHDIPLGSRVIAVADTFDAMTTDRPYRRGMPVSIAVEEIRRNSGTQFDPNVVAAFLRAMNVQEAPEALTSSQQAMAS
jgi:HD-GYP domain-containing protein (c-di-GMP phosphodiesterase class II)